MFKIKLKQIKQYIHNFFHCFQHVGQVEAIKQAMAGFSLPLGSQPQWAKVVPENVWKAELIEGLQQKHRHKPKPKAKAKQKKV